MSSSHSGTSSTGSQGDGLHKRELSTVSKFDPHTCCYSRLGNCVHSFDAQKGRYICSICKASELHCDGQSLKYGY